MQAVGYAGISVPDDDCGRVDLPMYVHPDVRRQGRADQLMDTLLRHARAWPGLRVVQLTVMEENLPARSLYERHGFVPFGLEPLGMRVGDRFVSRVLMWCDLAADRPAQ